MTTLTIVLSLLLGYSISSNGHRKKLLDESIELNRKMYRECFEQDTKFELEKNI